MHNSYSCEHCKQRYVVTSLARDCEQRHLRATKAPLGEPEDLPEGL